MGISPPLDLPVVGVGWVGVGAWGVGGGGFLRMHPKVSALNPTPCGGAGASPPWRESSERERIEFPTPRGQKFARGSPLWEDLLPGRSLDFARVHSLGGVVCNGGFM